MHCALSWESCFDDKKRVKLWNCADIQATFCEFKINTVFGKSCSVGKNAFTAFWCKLWLLEKLQKGYIYEVTEMYTVKPHFKTIPWNKDNSTIKTTILKSHFIDLLFILTQ